MALKLGNGKVRKDQTDHYGRIKGISGAGANSYASLTKVADYTYQATYNDIDYQKALAYFRKYKPNILSKVGKPKKKMVGLCSAFSFSNFACRTFDWLYSNMAEFIIHTPALNNRKAVVGIGNMTDLTASVVESGEYSKLYDILPFNLADGINENGLFVASLVVPNDKGVTRGTTPTVSQEIELPTTMIVRFLLDNFSNVIDATDYLEEHASIYNVTPLTESGYELHFFIKDTTGECGVIEFVNGALVYNKCDIATNFYIDGVSFNEDGSVYTPGTQDSEHDAIITNLITDHGAGLERYNLINEALPDVEDVEDLATILQSLIYTKTYDRHTSPFWYTEYVGGSYFCNTDPKDFDSEKGPVDTGIYNYDHRSRSNPITWQTIHGGIYDLENKTMYIIFQENLEDTYTFKLKTAQGGGVSIDDFVTSEDIIFSQANDKIQATLNKGPKDILDNAVVVDDLVASQEIVPNVDGTTGEISFVLANDVSNKVNNSLQAPLSIPSAIELVGIDTNKAQARINVGTGLSIQNGTLITTGSSGEVIFLLNIGSGTTGEITNDQYDHILNNLYKYVIRYADKSGYSYMFLDRTGATHGAGPKIYFKRTTVSTSGSSFKITVDTVTINAYDTSLGITANWELSSEEFTI